MNKKTVIALLVLVAVVFFAIGRKQVDKTVDAEAKQAVDNFFAEIEKVCDVDYENIDASAADKSIKVSGITVSTLTGDIAVDEVVIRDYKEGITVKDYLGNEKQVPESINVSAKGITVKTGEMLQKVLEMPGIGQSFAPEQIAGLTNSLDALGISDEIVIDYNVKSNIDFDNKTMDANVEFNLRGLLAIEEDISLTNIDITKLSGMKPETSYNPADPTSMEALEPVMDMVIGKCRVKLIDKSLVERVIKLVADSANTTPEEIKAGMAKNLEIPAEAADAGMPQFALDASKAMLNIVSGKADNITVVLNPQDGISIASLVQMGESNDEADVFAKLGLSVEQDVTE